MNSLMATTMAQYNADKAYPMEARRSANELFSKAVSSGKRHMFWQKLIGKQHKLWALSEVKDNAGQITNQSKPIVNVPLDNIVGSEGRANDFDQQFRPLVNHIRDRWVGMAVAYRRGKTFPPVELIQFGDAYYVRDGHHRISVAKMFGQATIEAEIAYVLT